MFYAFTSQEDINRVIAATKQVERSRPFLAQGRQRLRPPTGAVPLWVRSTGDVVDTDFADGFVVTFDDNGDPVDQGAVYLTTAENTPPAAGLYFGRITGRHEFSPGIGPLPVVRVVAVGDATGFWAEITGSGGSPLAYSWKRKVMTGPGTWADATEPTPLTGTTNAYRAPSNTTPPDIPTGQVVELRASLTSPGEYEIHAVGGIQTETFNIWRYTCDGTDLIETEYTVTIKGRDLDVSVA